jgi:uncharacterized protein
MTIVATFDGRSLPIESYDRVLASDPEGITNQPERLHHTCYRVGDGYVVVDVWTSAEAFAEFGKLLAPALAEAGVDVQPEIHEVHRVMPGTGRAGANVATVMALYEAFGRGDVEFIVDQLDADVEWESNGMDHGVPWLVPGRGHDHVRGFFGRLAETVELEVFEPGEPLTNERQVAVPVRARGRVKATGKTFADDPELHLWTFGPDGRVVSFKHLADTHQHWLALQP